MDDIGLSSRLDDLFRDIKSKLTSNIMMRWTKKLRRAMIKNIFSIRFLNLSLKEFIFIFN
jgi:hypothetical protein